MAHFRNTKNSYGVVAKFFHWIIAFLIMGLIIIGLYMQTLPYSPNKLEIYALHKSFGLLVLWLAGLRIIWKLLTVSPNPEIGHALWERILAKLAHLFLYISMIGMPLTGWLMSSAGEYPVPFFGINMPDLVGKNIDLARLMNQLHSMIGYLLILVISLHSLGAFKHHFIDQDKTLNKMIVQLGQGIVPYILVIILAFFIYGAFYFNSVEKFFLREQEKATEQILNLEIKPQNLYTHEWEIIKDQSTLSFRASVYQKEFTAQFEDFSGEIIFNPKDLNNSKVEIVINMSAVNSGDLERDQQIQTNDWFNTEAYPISIFRAKNFEVKSDSNYIVTGDLMIKGRSLPIVLPAKIDIVETEGERRAYVSASTTLNRINYGLGGERWKAADSVGLEVVVDIKLVAEAQ